MDKKDIILSENKSQEEINTVGEKVATSDSVVTEKSEAISSRRIKKSKRQVYRGQAHIQCTYNNTIITVTDMHGGVLGWSSAGSLNFKGAKKSTPYAAAQIVADVIEKVKKNQVKEVEVYVKGVGSGREAAIRAFANNGFDIISIKDMTPIPHNGCRPRRPRRV